MDYLKKIADIKAAREEATKKSKDAAYARGVSLATQNLDAIITNIENVVCDRLSRFTKPQTDVVKVEFDSIHSNKFVVSKADRADFELVEVNKIFLPEYNREVDYKGSFRVGFEDEVYCNIIAKFRAGGLKARRVGKFGPDVALPEYKYFE